MSGAAASNGFGIFQGTGGTLVCSDDWKGLVKLGKDRWRVFVSLKAV